MRAVSSAQRVGRTESAITATHRLPALRSTCPVVSRREHPTDLYRSACSVLSRERFVPVTDDRTRAADAHHNGVIRRFTAAIDLPSDSSIVDELLETAPTTALRTDAIAAELKAFAARHACSRQRRSASARLHCCADNVAASPRLMSRGTATMASSSQGRSTTSADRQGSRMSGTLSPDGRSLSASSELPASRVVQDQHRSDTQLTSSKIDRTEREQYDPLFSADTERVAYR